MNKFHRPSPYMHKFRAQYAHQRKRQQSEIYINRQGTPQYNNVSNFYAYILDHMARMGLN